MHPGVQLVCGTTLGSRKKQGIVKRTSARIVCKPSPWLGKGTRANRCRAPMAVGSATTDGPYLTPAAATSRPYHRQPTPRHEGGYTHLRKRLYLCNAQRLSRISDSQQAGPCCCCCSQSQRARQAAASDPELRSGASTGALRRLGMGTGLRP